MTSLFIFVSVISLTSKSEEGNLKNSSSSIDIPISEIPKTIIPFIFVIEIAATNSNNIFKYITLIFKIHRYFELWQYGDCRCINYYTLICYRKGKICVSNKYLS